MNGLRGLYLQCSGYPCRQCDVKTSLLRSYAEKQILEFLGAKLLKDEGLRARLHSAAMVARNVRQVQHPEERRALEKRRSEVQQRVSGILDCIEKGEDIPEVSARLSERRRELAEIQRQLDALGAEKMPTVPPTEEWITKQLEQLYQLLSDEPARAGVALRKLIGSIEVREVAYPGLKRKKLVGTFRLGIKQLGASALGVELPETEVTEEITISFAPLPDWAQRANEAKELYDQKLSAAESAVRLGLKFGAIAKALKWWYAQRGLTVPPGTEKRARIIRPTPIQDAVMEEVKKHGRKARRFKPSPN